MTSKFAACFVMMFLLTTHISETRAGAYGAHPDSVGEQHQTVTEPHTGLPMNIEKYGTDGRGGTDGSRTVEGYHEAPGTQTDWDAIKKGNTLY